MELKINTNFFKINDDGDFQDIISNPIGSGNLIKIKSLFFTNKINETIDVTIVLIDTNNAKYSYLSKNLRIGPNRSLSFLISKNIGIFVEEGQSIIVGSNKSSITEEQSSSSSSSSVENILDIICSYETETLYNAIEAGTSVVAFSNDGQVQALFQSVTSPGPINFNNIVSDNNKLIMYDVNTDAEFEGNITLSFYDDNIDPSKNPILVHLNYDPDSEEVVYENVTTEVTQGKISGTVSSLSPFAIITETQTIGIDGTPSGGFNPCLVLSGCSAPNCGFGLNVDPPSPCPGNQTRGNWVIENGVPIPRLFATKCDCYVPSIVTVDTVVGLAGSVGAARALVCAGWAGIKQLGIPALLSSIKNIKIDIKWITTSIAVLKNQLVKIKKNLDEFTIRYLNSVSRIEQLQTVDLPRNLNDFHDIVEGITGVDVSDISDVDEFADVLRNAQNQFDNWKNDPSVPDPDGFFRRFLDNWDENNALNRELEEVTDIRNDYYNKMGSEAAHRDDTLKQILDGELELSNKQNLLSDAVAELAVKEGQRASLLSSISRATADAFTSAMAMYAFVNEISFKKTCPEGETLNPLTCECCPNCTNDKVFPDPMSECDCVCPSDKMPCLAVLDDGCYDLCPPGHIRTSPDCSICVCIGEECSSSSSSPYQNLPASFSRVINWN